MCDPGMVDPVQEGDSGERWATLDLAPLLTTPPPAGHRTLLRALHSTATGLWTAPAAEILLDDARIPAWVVAWAAPPADTWDRALVVWQAGWHRGGALGSVLEWRADWIRYDPAAVVPARHPQETEYWLGRWSEAIEAAAGELPPAA